jgi:hypothetical protein
MTIKQAIHHKSEVFKHMFVNIIAIMEEYSYAFVIPLFSVILCLIHTPNHILYTYCIITSTITTELPCTSKETVPTCMFNLLQYQECGSWVVCKNFPGVHSI